VKAEAKTPQRTYGLWLVVVLVILTAWRVLAAWYRDLELFADEAQYWSWSLHLAWGYFSKPPMLAWLIRLGTDVFGDSETGVRSVAFILYPLSAWVIYLFTRRLFRSEADAGRLAFMSALAFATLPMTSLGSWLVTTDAPLLFFWALSMYFLVRALDTDRWSDWLLCGVAVGLGLLSKYSMVFFGLGYTVWLAFTPSRRELLRSPKPYVAMAVAAAWLAPNLWWNATHGFVSIRHTAHISYLAQSWFHPDALLRFFLAQFLVFGPILAAGLLLIAFRPRALLADERLKLLAAFSLVPLGAFLALALLSRAFANWAAFAYVAGAALVSTWWVLRRKQRWLVAALAVNLFMGMSIYHYRDAAHLLGVQLTRKTDPFTRISGYRELGRAVYKLLAEHPGTRLLGDERRTFATLLYYTRPLSRGAAYLNPSGVVEDHYALTADIKHSPHGKFILVSRKATPAQLDRWFKRVQPLEHIHIPIHPDYALDYQTWLVQDFKGY
jgi:4-amino-4-deoxy-L-arabinose transferase-like glycosyltransferase